MEFTSENVEEAVTTFYASAAEKQAQVHRWLTESQSSTAAWKFVWDLFDLSKTTEVQFFAAITLHSKIVKCWSEIPNDQYTPLKHKLLEAIACHWNGPKIVLNKLCTAMAAYIVNVMQTHWPDAVNELIDTFQHPPGDVPVEKTAWILLETLTALPEELQHSRVTPTHKAVVLRRIHENMQRVLDLVSYCLTDAYFDQMIEVKEQSAQCAAAWLRLGIPFSGCQKLTQNLLDIVLRSGRQPDVPCKVQSLVEASLSCLETLGTHPETQKHPKFVQELLAEMLRLRDLLPPVWDSGDEEITYKIYKLFGGVGECHSRLILKLLLEPGEAKLLVSGLVEVIMQATSIKGAYPVDESISIHALGFWYILQEDAFTLEGQERDQCLAVLAPIYSSLVGVLLQKSSLPDCLSDWTSDDHEKLRWYRQDIADSMMYCYQILNDHMLELLLANLSVTAFKFKESWQPVEANLHAWLAIAELVPCTKPQVHSFFTILQSIPLANADTHVYNTAVDCMGSYADWINVNPAVLSFVIPTVIAGLESNELAPASTMALKDLSRDCQLTLQGYADQIIICIKLTIQNGHLGQAENIRLMYAIGRLVSPMPLERIMVVLNDILLPFIKELEVLANSQEQGTQTQIALLTRLKMVSTIFATLDTKLGGDAEHRANEPQPTLLIIEKVFPVLEIIACRWFNDAEVIKSVCVIIKNAVSTLLEKFEAVLTPVVHLLVKIFQLQPHPSVLDLLQQVVVLFARQPQHSQIIQSLVVEMCRISMQFCFSSGNMSERCDVIEAFFNLLAQLSKKVPKVFTSMSTEEVTSFLRSATESLQLPETQVLKASTSFLRSFIKQSWENVQLAEIVNSCGEAIVQRILLCIAGNCPRSMIDHLAELLMMLNRKNSENFSRWLVRNISVMEFPGHNVSQNTRMQFANMVIRERANKRKLQEIVRGFTLICRGLAGTEYGGQVILF